MARVAGSRIFLWRGVSFGAVSVLIGIVLTYGFAGLEPPPNTGLTTPDWKTRVWFFFNAHFVSIVQSLSAGDQSMTLGGGVNLITHQGGYATFLYAIPLLSGVLGGLFMNIRIGARRFRHAAVNGASIVAGYLPAMLVAAYISSVSRAGFGLSARVGPSYMETLFLGGILVPAVAGVAGGAIYTAVRHW